MGSRFRQCQLGRQLGSILAATVASACVAATVVDLRATQAPAQPARVEQQHRAIIDKYCVTCHSDRLRIAGLTLEGKSLDGVDLDAEIWEKVVRKLSTRAMPPAGRPRPQEAEYNAVTHALQAALDGAAAARPEPGRPPVHRLNRTEYGLAIRDLMGLEIDSQALLPPDDASFGFDNIAEVLAMSPTLMERYMSAAAKVSQMAVGDPSAVVAIDTYTVPQLLLQDGRMSEDLPFGSSGGIAVRHHFPVDGEYAVRVRLRRNLYGYIRGIWSAHVVDVRIDGTRVARAKVGGEAPGSPAPAFGWTGSAFQGSAEWEDYHLHADYGMEFRFTATAGTHVVGVAFERNPSKHEGVLQPRITGFGYDADDSGNPSVGSVVVKGPYTNTGPGDTTSRRRIFLCHPGAARDEPACARRILSALARRAYRRPVIADDLDPLLDFYEEGRRAGGFEAGIQHSIERLLIDPEFLFRIERDPAAATPGSIHRLSDLELASRISFFLWSSIPDDELLDAAEKGRLKDPRVLEAQVRRMLADPRAKTLAVNFVTQWLDLRKAQAIMPDPSTFPDFTENLREAFRQETELFTESQLREDRSVVELLSANYTYVNDFLARHYGIAGVYGSHFRRVTLQEGMRNGLLGQGSVLMATSYGNRTSPVLRGKWLLDNILGTTLPPPPPDVPTLPDRGESGEVQSVRQRLERHRRNPVCAQCHDVMDPLGFSLENFDALGQWRAVDEAGRAVDASGKLADGTQLDGPAALGKHLLRNQDNFVDTFTEKLLTYALGRGVEFTDRPAIRGIVRDAAPRDYRWSAIVLGIVKSTPFQMRRKSAPK